MKARKVISLMLALLLFAILLATSQGQTSVSSHLNSFGYINYPTPTPTPFPSPTPSPTASPTPTPYPTPTPTPAPVNLRFSSNFDDAYISGSAIRGGDWSYDNLIVLAGGGTLTIQPYPRSGGPSGPPPGISSSQVLQHYLPASGLTRSQDDLYMDDNTPASDSGEIPGLSEYTYISWRYLPSNFDLAYLSSGEAKYDQNTWTYFQMWGYREYASQYGGDEYTVALRISKNSAGLLFWRINNKLYNGQGPGYQWDHYFDNINVPVPRGQWFQIRIYVNRNTGVMKFWINNDLVFDLNPSSVNHIGEHFEFTDGTTPRHYMKASVNYCDGACKVSSVTTWTGSVEIWSGYHE